MPIKGVKSEAGAVKDKEQLAQAAYLKLMEILKSTIKALEEGTLSAAQLKWLNHYFLLGNDNTAIPGTIVDKLKATKKGLKDTQFTVVIRFYNSANPKDKELIAIARAQFIAPNQLVRYMLHEATHLYAGTVDHTERGYTNNEGDYRQPGLTPEEALNNADSYACFVVCCNDISLT